MKKPNLLALLFLFLSLPALAQADAPSLHDKLQAQWDLYKQAQATLLQQVQKTVLPIEQRAISRARWESMLSLPAPLALNAQDISDLRQSQQSRIEARAALAKKASLIDLDAIRAHKSSVDFCEKLPKGGMLHVHPSGTMDREIVSALLQNVNPAIESSELLSDIASSPNTVSLYPEEIGSKIHA